MTNNDIRTNIKDYSVQDFQAALWQYVEDEMNEFLKSGNIDVKLTTALINYKGNSYGPHSMLLDMGFADLYDDVQDLIRTYATEHEDFHIAPGSYSFFERCMSDYVDARKTKKAITNEISNNPLIKTLMENGHYTFASTAVRFLTNDDERTKSANKDLQGAMYDMRAGDFFKVLKRVVEGLGE